MYIEIVIMIIIVAVLFPVCSSLLIVRRVKKQILEMVDALEDVKKGNGNRRILSETHELVAPLAYEINDIILSYESRLLAYHQTEETNRRLMTSLSHDVRTPLTTLIGYLDAAHKGIATGKERDDYIETARRKAHDLKEYIDVLFDWFKLGSNEFSMNISTIDLTELTRNILIDWIPIFEDVKKGNGNRRILSETHELVAPLAYEINDIILSYESRLLAYHQTEETNRRLMTSLSHDVRTPLTTLIGYLDAAHKGIATGKERDDYIETARRKAHDLKEYIDVLFDWFKLGSNEFSMNISTVDLTELTRNILIDWIPIFEDTQVDFSIDIPEQPFRVRIDPDGYMRILNNLIQNVISHSHADKIEISLSGQGGNIKILLRDNGVGIDKEDLKHIFERLYKCDKGRSEKGSGLGLSIVHQLVEKLNGTITADSVPGKGTVFTLLFPLTD